MAWEAGQLLDPRGRNKENIGFIHSLVAGGFQPTESYEVMKDLGMAGRKQNFLDVFRGLTYAYTNPEVYTPSDWGLKPRAELIPISTKRQARTWAYNIWTVTENSLTGQREKRHITINENSLISIEDAVNLAAEIALDYGFDAENVVESGVEWINYSADPIFQAYD